MGIAVAATGIVGVQAVALDVHGGMAAQCVDVGPVGGGGPAVQQAGGRKNEGAGADRAEAADLGFGITQPAKEGRMAA